MMMCICHACTPMQVEQGPETRAQSSPRCSGYTVTDRQIVSVEWWKKAYSPPTSSLPHFAKEIPHVCTHTHTHTNTNTLGFLHVYLVYECHLSQSSSLQSPTQKEGRCNLISSGHPWTCAPGAYQCSALFIVEPPAMRTIHTYGVSTSAASHHISQQEDI